MTFANSLDIDKGIQEHCPDLDQSGLTQVSISAPEIILLKKFSRRQQKHENVPSMYNLKINSFSAEFLKMESS